MSRIGKMPIVVPAGVTVSLDGEKIVVSGKNGKLERLVPNRLKIDVADGKVVVSTLGNDARNLHGLFRTLIDNMVQGVGTGFTRILDIVGVGYKAEAKGGNLNLALGYSHPVVFPLPAGVTAVVEANTTIKLSGSDKELVGQTAAKIRALRSPDAYKLKGIRYRGERLIKKAGKAAGK